MEAREKSHITQNLSRLVENTSCSETFLAILKAKGVLSNSDANSLLCIADASTKSYKFYEILQTRVNAYDALLEGLGQTKQTGALRILETIDEPETTKTEVTEKCQVCYSKIQIGKGSRATKVYSGTFGVTKVAVKVIQFDNTSKKMAMNEVKVLTELSKTASDNVVRFYEAINRTNSILIIMELCDYDLACAIQARKVDDSSKTNVLKQITKGLNFLHDPKRNIIHMDLKPENILLKMQDDGSFSVKLTDMGNAAKLNEQREASITVTSTHKMGTVIWIAPELQTLHGNHSTKLIATRAADIFSLGCVFYYVISNGKHPFGDRWRCTGNIADDKNQMDPSIFEQAQFDMFWLVRLMISHKASARPSTQNILDHVAFWSENKQISFLSIIASMLDRDAPKYRTCLNKYKNFIDSAIQIPLPVTSCSWVSQLCPSIKQFTICNALSKSEKSAVEQLLHTILYFNNEQLHLPENINTILDNSNQDYLVYWKSRFPYLLSTLWIHFAELKNEREISSFYSNFPKIISSNSASHAIKDTIQVLLVPYVPSTNKDTCKFSRYNVCKKHRNGTTNHKTFTLNALAKILGFVFAGGLLGSIAVYDNFGALMGSLLLGCACAVVGTLVALLSDEDQTSSNMCESSNEESECVQHSCDRLISVNKKIYKQGICTDAVIFTAQGESIKCHKSFLSVQSNVLKATIESCKNGEVYMPDLSHNVVEALLEYLYFCKITKATENASIAIELLLAASKYKINKLEEELVTLLIYKENTWFMNVDWKLLVCLSKYETKEHEIGTADTLRMLARKVNGLLKLKQIPLVQLGSGTEIEYESPQERTTLGICCTGITCSLDTIYEWQCTQCKSILDFDFDGSVYCECGKTPLANLKFKCTDSNHGSEYNSHSQEVLNDTLATLQSKHTPPVYRDYAASSNVISADNPDLLVNNSEILNSSNVHLSIMEDITLSESIEDIQNSSIQLSSKQKMSH